MNDDIHQITVTSWHELLYFFGYIKRNDIRISGIPKASDDFHTWSKKINVAIHCHYEKNDTRINRFIEKMLWSFNKDKSQIDEIEFICDNEKICMFAWLYIRQCSAREKQVINGVQKIPLYQDMHLPSQSQNHDERCYDISDYFSYGYLSGKEKDKVINSIHDTSLRIINDIKPLSWLDDKNDEQCEWACDYTMKRYTPENIDIDKPWNTQERYLFVHGLFSLMVARESEAKWKLFLADINRAWSQKKHRASKKEQLPLNTYLDKKTKEKLKVLCINNGVSIQTMLSHLITTEYNKRKEGKLT
ncbi:hypothetical protein [Pseudescherichia sp.]|uniref:hypothetical protein n=1 Tax=Pseudescherichia sp. TaxID=2055881 RepID=UPI00289DFD66|nr:hypothetical protein [Pseudescherichia sp.]